MAQFRSLTSQPTCSKDRTSWTRSALSISSTIYPYRNETASATQSTWHAFSASSHLVRPRTISSFSLIRGLPSQGNPCSWLMRLSRLTCIMMIRSFSSLACWIPTGMGGLAESILFSCYKVHIFCLEIMELWNLTTLSWNQLGLIYST